MDFFLKRTAPLWIPAGILLLAIGLKPQAIDSFSKLGIKPQFLFYTVGLAGLVLSWRFNRSRILLALISILASFAFLEFFTGKGRAVDETTASLVVGAVLCINFLAIAFLPERGVMSSHSRTAIMAISAEVVIVLLIIAVPKMSGFVSQIRHYGALKFIPGTTLSVITITLASVTAVVLLARTLAIRSAIDAGLLIALLAALTGLHFIDTSSSLALYFATAMLVMQTTIIQDSHARVYYDELTKLPARRALDEQMMRLGKHYVIAMVDIDKFKQFNDRFGHHVGDQALRFVATQLARTGGRVQVFRYGGEEFTLLFRGKTIDEVMPFIEQARERVEGTPFVVRGFNRPKDRPKVFGNKESKSRELITVSIGIAERTDKQRTPQDVIKKADRNLYKAKQAGRNCSIH